MRSLKVSGIIHLFAVLHAVVALSCHLAGINDELVLTLLTIVLIVLICLKRGLNVEFTAAQRDRRQRDRLPTGYGPGAQLIELLLPSPRRGCSRLDLHNHRDSGLEHRVVHQVVPPRRRHGEPLLGLDAPHRVAAAGRGGDFRAEAGLCRAFRLALLFHRPPLPHGRLAGFQFRGTDYPAVRQYHLCPAYAQA